MESTKKEMDNLLKLKLENLSTSTNHNPLHYQINRVYDINNVPYPISDALIILVIGNSGVWFDTINAAMSILKQKNLIPRKIILTPHGECPDHYFWYTAIQQLSTAYGLPIDNFLVRDAGCDDTTLYNWCYDPMFFSPDARKVEIDKANETNNNLLDKTKLYSSFARNPRIYRSLFTQELLKRNLEEYGLISCGSATEFAEQNYNDTIYCIIEEKYKHKFPLFLDSYCAQAAGSNLNGEMAKCLINIVLESSYDSKTVQLTTAGKRVSLNSNVWQRIFFTEKTTKYIVLRQLPLFLAPFGYVNYLRTLGLDVFDDVINHSYDTEPDGLIRIYKVADEIERLANIGLESLKANVLDFDKRTQYNIDRMGVIYDEKTEELESKIKDFINK
jgi:hypothetical protein